MTQPPPPPPPNQPPPPPGYGYPQGPNPYTQPPQAQPQPPYGHGYPQHPHPVYPPQPPSPGRKLNAQAVIIVSAVVAIALIIGGGVWYSSSQGGQSDDKNNASGTTGGTGGTGGTDSGDGGDDGGGTDKAPANTASKVLFQVPEPVVSADESSTTVVGSWLTDTVYAKTGRAEIVGYDPVKGTKLWTVPLPGPVCQASRHTNADRRTAIVYEPAMPTKDKPFHGCSQIAAIDLGAGRKLWTRTVKSGDQVINFDNVTVSANTVAVGGTSGGAAFDMTGKALWAPKPTDTCYDAGYGGGEKLVAVRKCGSYGARQLNIQTIDPVSGKVLSEYAMAKGIEDASVVSTNPLVVAADVNRSAGDGSGISDIFSIDNTTGRLRTKIAAPGDRYAARCSGVTRIEYCTKLAVGNDRLYLPTEDHDGTGEYSRTNEIVAFDLATGKQDGQRADAGDGYSISPLAMDGDNVIAYKRPPYDKGGQIVSIDGGSFAQTKLMENPATKAIREIEAGMQPEYAELIYADGRLYMSQVYARKPSVTGEKRYLAIAYGTN
ncbi:PQQ-binding-like beta-propeller repeat protein [Streptomyces sp. WI04-05B]|uniref:outer membrane protein assembly factor BamB family protein n=1 Tax=Streptomyces TaxID=1883 RepID=UPI0029B4DCF0|nr:MULTISPECIES: PQQ-binding-like beta-propeller repeat protein [unclassified Streptomyces]MDX2544411.1 PQQ-binding-like beta-propeller repeat protein [Streptomyces sp. WI04-05B]MDX2588520.1 PQQ-binding-like beta-propeller repeat protein [Streptomyces sp. WI04-05A]